MKRALILVLATIFIVAIGSWTFLRYIRPIHVTIQDLWMHRERWLEHRVCCEGKLEVFLSGKAGEYYTLDWNGYRVAVFGVPKNELQTLLGKDASAVGIFRFRDGFGVYIQTDRLAPARTSIL